MTEPDPGAEVVYRRHAIVSDADLREAARKLTSTIPGANTGSDAILAPRGITKSGS
jgi:hypothetical protein